MLILFSSMAMAEDKAPVPFDDSDIERTLKDGRVQKFDGNEYMIVKRGTKKEKPKVIVKTVTVKQKKRLNRISLLMGSAPNSHLEKSSTENSAKIEHKHQAEFGVQYQRLLNDRVSVGIQIQTNESVFGSVGYDF